MGKGQLLFKGDKKDKKNKKRKRTKNDHVQEGSKDGAADASNRDDQVLIVEHQSLVAEAPSNNGSVAIESSGVGGSDGAFANTPSIRNGSGKITTSGTVVTGYDTQFEKELSVGDAILVITGQQQQKQQEELRVITMCLSNTSLNLSSAFSMSIKVPQSFQYIRKPRNAEKEKNEAIQKRMKLAKETEKSVFDLYSNNSNTLEYREKTETGSYRIKRQELPLLDARQGKGSAPSREDLLDLRSKKTSDKYC